MIGWIPTTETRNPFQRPKSKVAELSERGLSVVFISSELEEVLRLSQRIVVMRDRRKIGELSPQDVDVDGVIDFIAHEGREGAA